MGRRACALMAMLIMVVGAAPAKAGDGLEIDWTTIAPMSGVVQDGAVVITADESGGVFPLAVIDEPPVGAPGFAVVGRVRYEAVEGRGFLEMWTVFPGGVRAFSRTLADEGPMAALSGTGEWRQFSLPFQLREVDGAPERLEIGVVLPGAGTVRVGPLRVVTGGSAGSAALDPSVTDDGAWWSDRVAGIAGAIAGTTIGVLGALLGSFAARGRSRRLVIGTMSVLTVAGAALTVAGLAALVVGQPFAVWFLLLLPGLLLASIFGSRLRGVRRAYAEAELRRIRALDSSPR